MMRNINSILRKYAALLLITFAVTAGFGQDEAAEQVLEEQRQAATLLSDASLEIEKENFAIAEAQYREAIDLNQKSEVGKLNLGNAYYNEALNESAMQRYKQAAQVATDKVSKHKAFHNLGNTFMNEKMYQEAVDAYKDALRNNPKDDETRYNLALAKEMLEKNPPPPQPDENGDDKDQDQKENEDKEDQDNKDQQDDGDEGEDGDKKEEKDEGDKKDDKKEGEDEEDKGKPDEPKDKKEGEDKQPQQQQPTPGKLSPQQVKSLLEAMNNEEKKVQDKINAKKEQGAKVKTQKDW